ncbi:MAG: dihydropteroate synthase [Endomicrobium sp.]|jgi:dihydropteroate synthase|nr:dihydropteroate synthase [Endomicrobium sp.]
MIVRKATINSFNDVINLVRNTKCSDYACKYFANKSVFNLIIVEKIDNRAANILKQEAISVGADAAIDESVSRFKMGVSNLVLFANAVQVEKLINKFRLQPFGLKDVSLQLRSIINKKKVFKCKQKLIDISNPIIMGIINMDPNSFSGDGFINPESACRRAVEFAESGAVIIDIGAESSRPWSRPIDAKREIKRLIPALKKIRRSVNIPISVDTYKYETAKVALSEGADIINDIFALRKGRDKLATLVTDTKAGLILVHMKGTPNNMQKSPKYKNCVSEIYEFLYKRKAYAMSFGINEECIAVDPGPGFGKTIKHNIELIKNMNVFSALGAVVGAVSRKRFVKHIVGTADKLAFVAANFFVAFYGADIIRVHDVKDTISILKIMKLFEDYNV